MHDEASSFATVGLLRRITRFVRWAGPEWTVLRLVRQTFTRIVYRISRRMMRIESSRFLLGPYTVSAEFNTRQRNAEIWNRHDWSRYGEEWTDDARNYRGLDPAAWKARLVAECLERYMPVDGTILEIGPGAGRWTEFLLPRSSALILVDVAARCLTICRDRFGGDQRLQYVLVDPEADELIGDRVADEGVDAVWSYDAFVHVNPTDTERYISEIRRILKPGGIAVIHHVGRTPTDEDYEVLFRSQMNAEFFADLVTRHGMRLVTQDWDLPHNPTDVISVFARPA
jgi:SAM-dependent methyltransferase